MRKKAMLLLSASLIAGGLLTVPAQAGGGAHCDPAVEDARSTTVALAMNCFTPTIARIDPGDEVTFVNKDATPHTVTAALFTFGGMEDLQKGDSPTFRFEDEGIFPYYCMYHPGMAGAIVVGDGVGKGGIATITESTTVTSDTEDAAGSDTGETATSQTAARSNSNVWSFALAGIGALAILLFVSTRIRKRVAAG
jgi:plastocyanin